MFVLAVLAAIVALSEGLVRATFLRHLGTALLVIVVTALVANLGLIPVYGADVPVYDGIFQFVAPLGIFWLLLGVSLRGLAQAGRSMLLLFLLGSAGTMCGVAAAMYVIDGSSAFGALYAPLGGMFVGTYVGGSINFNAIAWEFEVVNTNPTLYAGANAVDSLMTTIWMAATIVIPRGIRRVFKTRAPEPVAREACSEDVADEERMHPVDLAWLLCLGAGTVWFSGWASERLSEASGFAVPEILILTTVALVLAQLGPIERLRGARTIGLFAVYLFLAVIGALCDVQALRSIGELGWNIFLMVSVAISVHGLVVFGGGVLFKQDPDVAAVASQANVGGGTSALALARSLGRADLVLPAILVGSLGSALGTYLGLWTASALQ